MPCSPTDSSSKRVIRKPEITKNTSTPTNPPCTPSRSAWYSTTESTAKARKPSMSGRNLPGLSGCSRTCRPDGTPAPSDRRRVLVIGGRPPDAIYRAIPSRRVGGPANPEPQVQPTAEPRAAYVPEGCRVRRIGSFTCVGVLGGRVSHRAGNLRWAAVSGRRAKPAIAQSSAGTLPEGVGASRRRRHVEDLGWRQRVGSDQGVAPVAASAGAGQLLEGRALARWRSHQAVPD